jgi:hypothetical protein
MKRLFSHLAFFLSVPLAIGMSISIRCEADWVNNSSGGMPFDAIVGGHDYSETPANQGKVFYICRAYHNNDVQPGYALAGDSVCHFSYGGLELTSTNFDWYVPSWTYSYGQTMPVNAIALGAEPVDGTPTYRYPCRVNLNPGKYGQDFGACYFPYGGSEVHQPSSGFSWLVDPGYNVNPPSAASLAPMTFDQTVFDQTVVGPYTMLDMGGIIGATQSGVTYVNWPADAIVAGIDSDGSPLYVCTVFFQDGMQPGKARKDWNACDVSWGGSEHYIGQAGHFYLLAPAYIGTSPVSIFCNSSCSVATNPIPVGADSDGSTLYSCLGSTPDGLVVPGKTKAAWGSNCSFALNGVENYSFGGSGLVLTDGFR